MSKPEAATQRPKAGRSRRRILVKRALPITPGASNILVVKSGKDIHAMLEPRYAAMMKDYETVEFFWNTLMQPQKEYSDSKEWAGHLALVNKWELQEGVKNVYDYRAKMRRLKVWMDHFNPSKDYELTVAEVVEMQS
jgi:hypothetical protein